MSDNLAIILLMAIAIWSAVGLIVATSLIRKGKREQIGGNGSLTALSQENGQLRAQVAQLEARIAGVEQSVVPTRRPAPSVN